MINSGYRKRFINKLNKKYDVLNIIKNKIIIQSDKKLNKIKRELDRKLYNFNFSIKENKKYDENKQYQYIIHLKDKKNLKDNKIFKKEYYFLKNYKILKIKEKLITISNNTSYLQKEKLKKYFSNKDYLLVNTNNEIIIYKTDELDKIKKILNINNNYINSKQLEYKKHLLKYKIDTYLYNQLY